MKLSEIVKKYREEHGLSQRAFAKLAHTTNGYISMIETENNPASAAKAPNPSLRTLNNIAVAMGKTLDELIDEMDDMKVSLSSTKRTAEVTEEEAALLEAYRAASPETKEIIRRIING